MAGVVIERLDKVFRDRRSEKVHAVRSLDLSVGNGELLTLVGPSGCGKTTTLRLIAGLETPTGGTISIGGRVLNGVPPQDRDVAMVFQSDALYPHLTVFENLSFGLKLRKYSAVEIDRRVRDAAAMLGLAGRLEALPAVLSGGERQRVALGRAVVRQPKVFLFDEPLSHLDARLRAELRAEISKLQSHLGAPMIYVTHDQTEAMALGDRIAVMSRGTIQQVGAPLEVYQRPANMFVAGFLGVLPMNFFRGIIRSKDNRLWFEEGVVGQASCLSGESSSLPATPDRQDACPTTGSSEGIAVVIESKMQPEVAPHLDQPVVLGLRPEHITECRTLKDAPPDTAVEVVINRVELLGTEVHVHLRGGAGAFVARLAAADGMRANARVTLSFDMRHAKFFDPSTEAAIT